MAQILLENILKKVKCKKQTRQIPTFNPFSMTMLLPIKQAQNVRATCCSTSAHDCDKCGLKCDILVM